MVYKSSNIPLVYRINVSHFSPAFQMFINGHDKISVGWRQKLCPVSCFVGCQNFSNVFADKWIPLYWFKSFYPKTFSLGTKYLQLELHSILNYAVWTWVAAPALRVTLQHRSHLRLLRINVYQDSVRVKGWTKTLNARAVFFRAKWSGWTAASVELEESLVRIQPHFFGRTWNIFVDVLSNNRKSYDHNVQYISQSHRHGRQHSSQISNPNRGSADKNGKSW